MRIDRSIQRKSAAVLLGFSALVTINACSKSDDVSAAETTKAETMVIGPENIAVAANGSIMTGPSISGTLEPERAAVLRAQVAWQRSPDLRGSGPGCECWRGARANRRVGNPGRLHIGARRSRRCAQRGGCRGEGSRTQPEAPRRRRHRRAGYRSVAPDVDRGTGGSRGCELEIGERREGVSQHYGHGAVQRSRE